MVSCWLLLLTTFLEVDGFNTILRTVRIHNYQNNNRIDQRFNWILKPKVSTYFTFLSAFGEVKPISNKTSKNALSLASSPSARLNYRRDDDNEEFYGTTPISVTEEDSVYDLFERTPEDENIEVFDDPSMIEFVEMTDPAIVEELSQTMTLEEAQAKAGALYPFAVMMQGSAVYIAAHAGKVAVFHLPGELIENESTADHILSDMALCWLLGMKIVIVVGSRYEADTCVLPTSEGIDSMMHSHECHNALRITDSHALRFMEEEAGFLRTEIERKLNKCLRAHGSGSSTADAPSLEGNVVGGNFYTARQFGIVRGEDFQHTGFTTSVNIESINKVLNNKDVVLLSAVGLSPSGELVNVNSYHLAATVASALQASKIIYIANEGSVVLRKKGERTSIQELPLSFSKAISSFHQVKCHNTGFATFERARKTLNSGAVELLLHLGWANWALDRGVRRAHIVNPSDGALLEELFTSKNGANTCLYHDEDGINDQEETVAKEVWDEFFESAHDQGGQILSFT